MLERAYVTRKYSGTSIGEGRGDISARPRGSGMKGKRDVACTGLPVSWMPVKFPEYYSVRRSPLREAGASGLVVREDRPRGVLTVVLA